MVWRMEEEEDDDDDDDAGGRETFFFRLNRVLNPSRHCVVKRYSRSDS